MKPQLDAQWRWRRLRRLWLASMSEAAAAASPSGSIDRPSATTHVLADPSHACRQPNQPNRSH